MPKREWRDLSPQQQRLIVVGGAAELVLTTVALRDLRRRPREQVRGPKPIWVVAMVVQPFGPLAYFFVGRRRSGR
jgi:Phospholipase_D-nuclease N-terminal